MQVSGDKLKIMHNQVGKSNNHKQTSGGAELMIKIRETFVRLATVLTKQY